MVLKKIIFIIVSLGFLILPAYAEIELDEYSETDNEILKTLQRIEDKQDNSTFLGIYGIVFGILALIVSISIATIISIQSKKHTKLVSLHQEGNFYYNTGDYLNALKNYKDFLKNDKNNIAILHNVGATLDQLDRWKDSIPYYEKILQIEPNNTGALNNLGLAYEVIGDHYNSAFSYYKGLQVDINTADVLNNIGKLYLDQFKKYDLALHFFNRITDEKLLQGIELVDVIVNKANVYFEKKDYCTSIKFCDQALQIDNTDVKALRQKVNSLYHLKEFGNTILCSNIVLKISPENDDVLLTKANALLELGFLYEAIITTNEYILRNSNDPKGYYNVGVAFVKFGYLAIAQSFFEKAIECDSTFLSAHYNIGTGYLKMNMPELALEAFERGYENALDNYEYLGNMGESLFLLGDFRRSFLCFNQAFHLNPTEIGILSRLSDCLEKLGEISLATDCLKLSLLIEDIDKK